MELGEQIKKFRKEQGWTQKEMAVRLNVSDKTVSSWETNRTYPDISMLICLSEIFNLSLDEFIKGDVNMVKKIDKDLKLKKVYKYALVGVVALVAGVILFLNIFQYKNQWVDRFNPFMEMQIGYATLPTEVTYNGGKEYQADSKKLQIPDAYKDIWVLNDPFGNGAYLTFQGGEAPAGRNYAMIQHKGLYVKQIAFVSWNSIPAAFRNNMNKEYVKISKYGQ